MGSAAPDFPGLMRSGSVIKAKDVSFRAVIGFDRWSGGALDHDGAGQISDLNGHRSSVVPGATVRLLVSPIVAFVDNDETRSLERSEYRISRTDHNARFPRPQPAPFVKLLACREATMEQRHTAAESVEKPIHYLGRLGDLGHQNADVSVPGECLGCRLKVYFGLSAPRDAMEQHGFGRLDIVKAAHDGVDRLQLGRREVEMLFQVCAGFLGRASTDLAMRHDHVTPLHDGP